jgi:transposase-like protein
MSKQTSNKFSPEVREQAMQMVFDHQTEHPSQWATITSIARKLQSRDASAVGFAANAGLTTDERERIKALERDVRELRQTNGGKPQLISQRRSSTARQPGTNTPGGKPITLILRKRPRTPAKGHGSVQRAIKRAFAATRASALTSTQIYDWAHVRRRLGRRKSMPFGVYSRTLRTLRTLRAMCDPVERVPPHGAWQWRLRNTADD